MVTFNIDVAPSSLMSRYETLPFHHYAYHTCTPQQYTPFGGTAHDLNIKGTNAKLNENCYNVHFKKHRCRRSFNEDVFTLVL